MRYMEFEFDDGRLKRATGIVILKIDIEGNSLPVDHYMAMGGSGEEHYLHIKPFLDCDCDDFSWGTNRLCKHLIAALIYTKDELFDAVAIGHQKLVVTFVCGPPASGKSRYIEGVAKKNDFVWDFDRVMETVTHGASLHDRSVTTMHLVREMYKAMTGTLRSLMDDNMSGLPRAWVQIMRPPSPGLVTDLNAEVVTLRTPVEECVTNATEQGRTPEQIKSVERGAEQWWEVYGGR